MTIRVILRFLIMLIHLLVIIVMLSSRSQTMFGTMPMLSGFRILLSAHYCVESDRLCRQAVQTLLTIIMTVVLDDMMVVMAMVMIMMIMMIKMIMMIRWTGHQRHQVLVGVLAPPSHTLSPTSRSLYLLIIRIIICIHFSYKINHLLITVSSYSKLIHILLT